MKKLIQSLLALAAFGGAGLVAQAQPAPKIFVVDMAKLYDGHYRTEEQNAKLKADEQKAQEELDKLNKEGNSLVERYKELNDQSNNPAATAEAKAKAQSDAQKLLEEIQQKQREVQTFQVNTRNSLVMSRDNHLAVQGMEGVAVVASEDAVYVGRLDDSQQVGNLVKLLAADKKTATLTENHPTSLRPWGGYTSVLNGERFQVKRLFVHPGKKLSLQKHHHRSEHWICVKGAAEVTIDDKVTMLHENQSIYIPQGAVHRLGNPGKILLELIEIQTGSYLGEDDIIRLVDEFGRS
jgi:mannose-6-phosphate isomerase-like protein (cupin superfamily)/Skp family chaperone for outer membrane proteins